MFPQTLMVGMEIRVKVSDYVMDRIIALRQQHPDMYQNIACIRTNACLLYTSPSPRDRTRSRMPSSA